MSVLGGHGPTRAIYFCANKVFVPHLRCLIHTLKKYGNISNTQLVFVALADHAPEQLRWLHQQGVLVVRKEPKRPRLGSMRWKWWKTQMFEIMPSIQEYLYLDCDIIIRGDISKIWDCAPRKEHGEVATIYPHDDDQQLMLERHPSKEWRRYQPYTKLGYRFYQTFAMLFKRGISDAFLRTWAKAIDEWWDRREQMDQAQLYELLKRTHPQFKIRHMPRKYGLKAEESVIPEGCDDLPLVHYRTRVPSNCSQHAELLKLGYIGPNSRPKW